MNQTWLEKKNVIWSQFQTTFVYHFHISKNWLKSKRLESKTTWIKNCFWSQFQTMFVYHFHISKNRLESKRLESRPTWIKQHFWSQFQSIIFTFPKTDLTQNDVNKKRCLITIPNDVCLSLPHFQARTWIKTTWIKNDLNKKHFLMKCVLAGLFCFFEGI